MLSDCVRYCVKEGVLDYIERRKTNGTSICLATPFGKGPEKSVVIQGGGRVPIVDECTPNLNYHEASVIHK